MKNNAEKIAVIDIGSNSVRLFIFQLSNGKPAPVTSQKFFCGLGKDLGTTGLLNAQSVALTHDALASFQKEISRHDIAHKIVVATAALREAKDADIFIRDVKNRSGFEIKVIDGEEEARLAALAVVAKGGNIDGVVADFGGGSLELASITGGDINHKTSLKLGAHYLKALGDKRQGIASILGQAVTASPDFVNRPSLYIIGGSWRSLAKALLEETGQPVENLEIIPFKPELLKSFCADLQKMEPAELIARYHMEEPRAALMDVAALMLECLIETLSPSEVWVSKAGIRDGLVHDYILRQVE